MSLYFSSFTEASMRPRHFCRGKTGTVTVNVSALGALQ
ncbi:hypothetical protein RC1_2935 [Rhodospirillum centenum SW]|uniref:Uncharacterized protein n=1 Tax=Rhodospirillum centenum (strain ATCC 51521 / SW) TaxID=414684 RepID=B6IVH9_RHOCS|nr:hypothetical protein RC1_2935 [Rhodospirillum centenum SW]